MALHSPGAVPGEPAAGTLLKADATASGTAGQMLEMAIEAERRGLDRVLLPEMTHNPFLPLSAAAGRTSRIELATGVALAFARTPMTLAYEAWGLQEVSAGRAVIGLGTQIKAHIERRFGMPWDRPAPRMREFVQATRAIWDSWQRRDKLAFEGEYYSHTLMTPTFDPGPLPSGAPPIILAGVGPMMTRVAGEVGDGFICHPFGTVSYLRDTVLPGVWSARAASEAAKQPWTTRPFEVNGGVLVATGHSEEELARAIVGIRERIAFYASTPAYRAVLEHHGWEAVQEELHTLARESRWREMGGLIDDEMLHTIAVVGEPREAALKLVRRFGGVAHRVTLFDSGEASSAAILDVLSSVRELGAVLSPDAAVHA